MRSIHAVTFLVTLAISSAAHLGPFSIANTSMRSPYVSLEKAAYAAHSNSTDSVHTLTDAVLSFPHIYPIPDSLKMAAEDRIVAAELRYRTGGAQGVSEAELIKQLNDVGVAVNLPSYAKLTQTQLRDLRVRLAVASPLFMGIGLSTHALKRGESISPMLSPLQALHLFLVMADQKLANDDYQDAESHPSELTRKRLHNIGELRKSGPVTGNKIVLHNQNSKAAQTRALVFQGVQGLSTTEGLNLIDQTLDLIASK